LGLRKHGIGLLIYSFNQKNGKTGSAAVESTSRYRKGDYGKV
jgi:hypothetical protein